MAINQPDYSISATSGANAGGGWVRVTRARPCPICGHTGWCQIAADGSLCMCMRIEGGRQREAADGTQFWLHRLSGRWPASVSVSPPATVAPRANLDILDRVYRELLAGLSLSQSHRENLRSRGLPDAEIDLRGYCTLPQTGRAALARRLVDRFGAETCSRVPGFCVREEEGRGWWSVAGCPGILIPVRDVWQRIVALLVRRDDPVTDGCRYLWISSRRYGGPTPGSPAHLPLYDGETETVRVTEGVLKGDVCTVLSGMVTVGAPGVGGWRATLPVLRALSVREVRLAYDADWRENATVRRALAAAAAGLTDAGYVVSLETWDE